MQIIANIVDAVHRIAAVPQSQIIAITKKNASQCRHHPSALNYRRPAVTVAVWSTNIIVEILCMKSLLLMSYASNYFVT